MTTVNLNALQPLAEALRPGWLDEAIPANGEHIQQPAAGSVDFTKVDELWTDAAFADQEIYAYSFRLSMELHAKQLELLVALGNAGLNRTHISEVKAIAAVLPMTKGCVVTNGQGEQ